MTPRDTVANRRARLVRLIHVGKSQLLLGEDDYRALIRRASRGEFDSTKDLELAQLEDVLRELKLRGFVVTVPKARGPQRRLADDPLSKKIRALWLSLHAAGVVRSPEESALGAYVRRMTGVEALDWLSDAQAHRVIEGLKKWAERLQGESQ